MSEWNRALEKNVRRISRGVLLGILFLLLTKLNKKERFSIVVLELPRMQESKDPNHACSQGLTTLRSHAWLILTTVSNLHRMLVVHLLRCGILRQGAAFAGRGMKQGSRSQWEKVARCSTFDLGAFHVFHGFQLHLLLYCQADLLGTSSSWSCCNARARWVCKRRSDINGSRSRSAFNL